MTPHPSLEGTIHTAAEEVRKAGGKCLACVCDIRYEDQINKAIEETIKTFGGIYSLILRKKHEGNLPFPSADPLITLKQRLSKIYYCRHRHLGEQC